MLARAATIFCVIGLAALVLAACGEDRKGGVSESGGSTATTGTGTTGTETTGTGTTGTGTTTTPAPSGPAVAKVRVKETEYELAPENPRVAKAGAVSFEVVNAGKITHALEIEGPGGEVETKGIQPGSSATLRADLSKPGTYEWYCPIGDHKERGMKGRITVAGGGSGTSKDDSGKGDDGSGKSGDSGKRSDDPGKRNGGAAGGVY